MSFAIHIFMTEKFSWEAYQCYLGKIQHLYGRWDLEEEVRFEENGNGWKIHECCLRAWDLPSDERFSVWVAAQRTVPAVSWGFNFEWYLSFETSAGRSFIGLAVQ